MNQTKLNQIVTNHQKWLDGAPDGVQAYLYGAYLTEAYLTETDLSRANLTRASLYEADLTGTYLSGADLTGADLTGANLSRANLTGANLTGANLTGANLSGTNLGADLSRANLDQIRADVCAVLAAVPAEVPALLAALKEGRVDGSCYVGSCACLVGTLANARGCDYREIPGVKPDPYRPAERWFTGIRKGDTPETNQISAITVEWVEGFLQTVRQ